MLQSNRRVTALRSRNHETEVSNNKTALTRLWTCWLQTWGWLLLPPWPSAGRASDWWLPPSPPHPGAENQTDQSLHGATTTPRVPQGMGAMWPALLCHEKSGNSLKKKAESQNLLQGGVSLSAKRWETQGLVKCSVHLYWEYISLAKLLPLLGLFLSLSALAQQGETWAELWHLWGKGSLIHHALTCAKAFRSLHPNKMGHSQSQHELSEAIGPADNKGFDWPCSHQFYPKYYHWFQVYRWGWSGWKQKGEDRVDWSRLKGESSTAQKAGHVCEFYTFLRSPMRVIFWTANSHREQLWFISSHLLWLQQNTA